MTSSIVPYSLSVDRQHEPQSILHSPLFSWKLRGIKQAARQSAYRIRVSGLVGIRPSEWHITWDSGWVEDHNTLDVPYRGSPLVSSTTYRVSLLVRDGEGATTDILDSQFGTGIVHADEWDAHWIKRNPHTPQQATPPQDTDISLTVNKLKPVRHFVKQFELPDAISHARVHVTAKGAYQLFVNGERVGRDQLVPGWVEYRDRIPYQSFDVSGLLRPGQNSIAALLADGWWCGFIGTDRRRHALHYGEEPELLAQLDITTTSGERTRIVTDQSWHERASHIAYADMLMGQYEDARNLLEGWNLPDSNISDWTPAQISGDDASLLVPDTDAPVRAALALSARSITTIEDGRHIVDFGQNLVGHARLVLRHCRPGTRIRLNHAEVLTETGDLYTENLRTAEPIDVYWTRGAEREVFEPEFTLHGFRYMEITGLPSPPDLADVSAVVVHNEFDWVGEIETSDADLNQLLSNINWGLRGNFVSVPTDCPQRDERLGWTADAQVFTPTACYNVDAYAFFRRWLVDVRGAQSPAGAFPDTAPHMVHVREGAPAWGDAGVTIPWHLYRTYGAVQILQESIDSMTRWVDYIERNNSDLIWRNNVGNNYGDWLQVYEETRRDVLATAYFAHSADLVGKSLRVLGRDQQAEHYEALFGRISDAFRVEFIDHEGRIQGDTQTSYLLALAFGLVQGDLKAQVADHLVETVERRDRALTTGFVGVGLLCPTLSDIGRPDLALELVHRDEYPSWLYSVRNGATTIWERWDGWTSEHGFQSARMNSFNHYSLGSVGEWFYSRLLGIRQSEDSTAFRDLVIEPSLDPALDWARASYDSALGEISSAWSRDADGIELRFIIPPGARARIVLPASAAPTESGAGVTESTTEMITSDTESSITFEAESGTYTFRIVTESHDR